MECPIQDRLQWPHGPLTLSWGTRIVFRAVTMDLIGYKTCKLFVFFSTFTCRGSRVYIRNQPPRLTGQVTWCCTRVVSPFPFYHEDEELHWVGKDGSSEQTTVFPIIQGVVESAVHHTAVPACSLKNPRVETYYSWFLIICKKHHATSKVYSD